MNGFRTTVRRALDRARRLTTARRAAPVHALALAATLLASALGPPAPVGVAAAPAEPAARLQIVVKEVTIHDDHDGRLRGVGEMLFHPRIWRCNEGVPVPCDAEDNSERGFIVIANDEFQASTGETVTLNRPLPRNGDTMLGGNTSEKLGFAVYAGERYVLRFMMQEDDGLIPPRYEQLGEVFHFIDTAEHGLGLGTHTVRPFMDEQYRWGDFTITYEIRRTPLPDLRPVNIKVHDLPGSAKKRVCMAVQNVEVGHAGAFEVDLLVDGTLAPFGRAAALAPAPGNHVDVCLETELPDSGEHVLAAVVDERRALIEFNEANNVHEQPYVPARPAPTPAPTPAPSADLPDLVVTAIKVNGQVPDGKDDCKDGKNDVTVIVKNQGPTTAGDFFVQLVVDDDQGGARQQGLAELEAGAEAPIKFGGVTMKEGPHTLVATTDWTTGTGIAESNEANNARTATASCKDND